MAIAAEEIWRCERRARILAAAARVFANRPYAVASMEAIAREAGFGKPTVYRYFPGKDVLFAAVFAEVLDDLERRLDRILAAAAPTEATLTALAAAIVPVFRDHLATGLVDDNAAADLSKRRAFRNRQVRIAARLGTALEQGTARGLVRPVDAARTGRLMLGTIWSAAVSSDAPADAVAAEVVDLLLHGLSAAPSGAWGPARARYPGPEVFA